MFKPAGSTTSPTSPPNGRGPRGVLAGFRRFGVAGQMMLTVPPRGAFPELHGPPHGFGERDGEPGAPCAGSLGGGGSAAEGPVATAPAISEAVRSVLRAFRRPG